MSPYNHPTRYTNRNRQATPTPTQTHKAWFKSPIMLSVIFLGISVLGATLFVEFTTQHIIHFRADDNSDSAENYTAQRQQHCQASIQQYKPGDMAITIPFADHPVTTQKISIFNSLSLLGKCQDTKRDIKSKQRGTSLILLLKRIEMTVQKERARKNFNPVVATIAIQDDEPGPNQPNPNDIEQIKTLVHSITEDKGAIAFMVEDETLKNQLETDLATEGKVQICDLKDISNCVTWALETARKPASQ
ncbi:hypothetical protein BCD67_00730 [Oscillatoriales cyanobacterium USR001]|nr:hypothetical protein BCD67_00730 [Oscillatoriales cyanobacterium USR001]